MSVQHLVPCGKTAPLCLHDNCDVCAVQLQQDTCRSSLILHLTSVALSVDLTTLSSNTSTEHHRHPLYCTADHESAVLGFNDACVTMMLTNGMSIKELFGNANAASLHRGVLTSTDPIC